MAVFFERPPAPWIILLSRSLLIQAALINFLQPSLLCANSLPIPYVSASGRACNRCWMASVQEPLIQRASCIHAKKNALLVKQFMCAILLLNYRHTCMHKVQNRMLLTRTPLLSLRHSLEFPVLLWWWISSPSGSPSCHDLPSIHHSTHPHCFRYRDFPENIPKLHVSGMYVLHGLKQTCRAEGETTSSFSNINILVFKLVLFVVTMHMYDLLPRLLECR